MGAPPATPFLFMLAVLAIHGARGAEYTVTQCVFLDISVGGEPPERIVLGLFGTVAPRTVRNFVTLVGNSLGGRTYIGTPFHRVIRRFMIQGGDVVHRDGTGSLSLYGHVFDDETFAVKHSAPGFLSMANAGRNTNGCQFFITTVPAPWLDDHHVAFGKVLEGMAVVHKIENVATDADDRPLKAVLVVGAGTIPTPQPFTVTDDLYNIWEWIRGASVPLTFSFAILIFFHWMIRKLDVNMEEHHIPAVTPASVASSISPIDENEEGSCHKKEVSKSLSKSQ